MSNSRVKPIVLFSVERYLKHIFLARIIFLKNRLDEAADISRRLADNPTGCVRKRQSSTYMHHFILIVHRILNEDKMIRGSARVMFSNAATGRPYGESPFDRFDEYGPGVVVVVSGEVRDGALRRHRAANGGGGGDGYGGAETRRSFSRLSLSLSFSPSWSDRIAILASSSTRLLGKARMSMRGASPRNLEPG